MMSKNILIIENDEQLLEILRELFTHEGYNVIDLPQAYAIQPVIREFVPDLILLDFLLPGTNGGELCIQVKRNEKTRHIPVIIMSAFPRVMLSLGDYGCNAFVAKPFEIVELMKQVKTCLADPQGIYIED